MAREMENLRKELDELEKNGKEIDLKCNKCGKNFIHSVPDQIRFRTKKWTNLPGKCSECRDGEPCFDFHKTSADLSITAICHHRTNQTHQKMITRTLTPSIWIAISLGSPRGCTPVFGVEKSEFQR